MVIRVNNSFCDSTECLRSVASEKFAAFVEEYYNDSPYVVAHTSGSTGVPKEIRLLKSDMRNSAKLTNSFFSLTADSLFYLPLSPDYIAGKMMIVRALELGASIIEESPTNRPMADYSGDAVDLLAVVPSQMEYILENPETHRYVKSVIIGGGIIPPNLYTRIVSSGINAYATYGMTETCSHIALSKITAGPSPFVALGDVTFETDERGCLIINAPHFSNNRIVTNDIVELIDPRTFNWRGRYDNVINSGGIKIFPEEIEPRIAMVIDKPFFITSRQSDKWGEEPVIVMEDNRVEQGCFREEVLPDDVICCMKKLLPAATVPRVAVFINRFVKTDSGKLIRKIHGDQK